MADNEIRTKLDALTSFDIDLDDVADGSGESSDFVDNNATAERRGAFLSYWEIASDNAATPDNGAIYEIYLLRADADPASGATYRTDNAGATKGAITIENATLMGTIVVTANTSKTFYGDFDSAPMGPIGFAFAVAMQNESGATTSGTAANHSASYALYLPEIE